MMRRDRGGATVMMAIMASAWVFMLALVIVGGGRIRAYQRADNIAAEAARAAGSAIDPSIAVPGGPKVVDPAKAQEAALAYLAAAGASGSVVIAPGGTELTVTAHIEYANPSGLEFLGGATWEATGEATATLLVG